jgi:hypothetical protein
LLVFEWRSLLLFLSCLHHESPFAIWRGYDMLVFSWHITSKCYN